MQHVNFVDQSSTQDKFNANVHYLGINLRGIY